MILTDGRDENNPGTAPGTVRNLDDVLALGSDGSLDLGEGARAIVSAGVVRVGRTPAREPKR